jgi:hypothetical protein
MNTTVRYKFTTGVLISPYPDQDGNKLQWPNCNFCKSHKKNSESCPSNKVSAAGMTCASVKKWWFFKFFFFFFFWLRTYQHPFIYWVYKKLFHDTSTFIAQLSRLCYSFELLTGIKMTIRIFLMTLKFYIFYVEYKCRLKRLGQEDTTC